MRCVLFCYATQNRFKNEQDEFIASAIRDEKERQRKDKEQLRSSMLQYDQALKVGLAVAGVVVLAENGNQHKFIWCLLIS